MNQRLSSIPSLFVSFVMLAGATLCSQLLVTSSFAQEAGAAAAAQTSTEKAVAPPDSVVADGIPAVPETIALRRRVLPHSPERL